MSSIFITAATIIAKLIFVFSVSSLLNTDIVIFTSNCLNVITDITLKISF